MTTQSLSHAKVSPRVSTRAAAMIALFFGAFIVFTAGLAQSETLHNAAHDTRHSFGLPCH